MSEEYKHSQDEFPKLAPSAEDIIHKWLKANLELCKHQDSYNSTTIRLKLRGEEISAVTIYHG